jgi:hypothetical protein
MRDADAESCDDRTDGTPTGASRLRVPKMRVCHERVGKRGGPVVGSMQGGTRLTQFHPRKHNFRLSRAIPASFIVARADEVIE